MARASRVAEAILATAFKVNMLKELDRKAFILTLWRKGNFTPMGTVKVGFAFPDENFRLGCWELSQEKVERQFKLDHTSSFQSRNVEKRRYAGAVSLPIRFVTWGIGVSGLKELEDEALALLIGIYTFKISFEDRRIQDILEVSNNYKLTSDLMAAAVADDGGYYWRNISSQPILTV